MLSNRDHLYGPPSSIVGLASEHVPNLLTEVNAPRSSIAVSVEYNEGQGVNPRQQARAITLQTEAAQKAKAAKLKAFQEGLTRRVKAMALQKKQEAAAAAALSPPRSGRRHAGTVGRSKPPIPVTSTTKGQPSAPAMPTAVGDDQPLPPPPMEPLSEALDYLEAAGGLEDSNCDSTNIGTDVAVASHHEGDGSTTATDLRDEEDEEEADMSLLLDREEESSPADSLVGRIVTQSFMLDEFARAKLLRHKVALAPAGGDNIL